MEAEEETEPQLLTADTIGEILSDTEIPETAAAVIEESYREEFRDEAPVLDHLLDGKAAGTGGKLRVKPEKAAQIKSQIIGGQKCLIIPMDENEHAAINGVHTTV